MTLEARGTGELVLGFPGYAYADLFLPESLARLAHDFEAWFAARDPGASAQFGAYRACRGQGMTPVQVSDALLCAAPHVSAFVAHLFGVEAELNALRADIQSHLPGKVPPSEKLDFAQLIPLKRPDPARPGVLEGVEATRRQRVGFALTDPRMTRREVERELHLCILCHERDKDSCAKGLRDKTGAPKRNPLGMALEGCPLGEKISEMHALYRAGDPLAALALVCIDNPLCPGTGHRICNECMRSCIFQKQEPVNIPQVETRALTEVLALPWGVEIYGLLTRWNPLNVERSWSRPHNGKKVLVVGLGPAGYTLAHHLASEGFGVVGVEGLKLEPLPEAWVGPGHSPIRDVNTLDTALDERTPSGFGGVSEYGITVRWDKNFLTLLHLTLARNPLIRMHGGVRFGGTLTLQDAWSLGVDHVALATGAGSPKVPELPQRLAQGVRTASDFLMGLQLTGAYRKSSLANLQVSLPAVVLGGGLTAIDTATELAAYYPVQMAKEAERYEALVAQRGFEAVRALFDPDEWATLSEHRAHAEALRQEKALAEREGRPPNVQALLKAWGGVTVVYRKSLQESPAYRLNHEEVTRALEEGIAYREGLSPIEVLVDPQGAVTGVRCVATGGGECVLPARSVLYAMGTSPNLTCVSESPGLFSLDPAGLFFQPHRATVDAQGDVHLAPAGEGERAFFTNVLQENRTLSFYGDGHPLYAGNVVKAMASAKDGYPAVVALFPEIRALDPRDQPLREQALDVFFTQVEEELAATVVAVHRLTPTIVELVVRARRAAQNFQPGQFYRLQTFEASAKKIEGTCLALEPLALTGAWTDPAAGLLGTVVLEMGASSRLCADLKPGDKVVLMGPTGTPTETPSGATVLLCGGGLGNAVLFSIAAAFRARGGRVLYVAGYKRGEDLFHQEEIERSADRVVWCTDGGLEIPPRRPQDRHVRGTLVEALLAYAEGALGPPSPTLEEIDRVVAIGSDGMMHAVQAARHGPLARWFKPGHQALGSINSPMQCMMKGICGQCLQLHRHPDTGEETLVFSCAVQDQPLDHVDFLQLRGRLRANSMQEKLATAWLDALRGG